VFRSLVDRRTRCERYEDRLALSAAPLGDSLEPETPHAVQTLALESAAGADDALDYVRRTYGFLGAGQTVAIVDSGIAYDHPALGGGWGDGYRVVGGWDFAENDADPYDDAPAGFHGTHVAGILASSDAVHRGLAPAVDLVGLRVFDDQGYGEIAWVEQALRWIHENRNAFAHPITTVNLSLGSQGIDASSAGAAIEDELEQLKADGIFVVAAAGNGFGEIQAPGLAYPASSPHVVPVASVGADGALSDFSQRDSRVLAAPGERITSTVPDFAKNLDGKPNDFEHASGASMATPYVAGAGVLLREAMLAAGWSDITPDLLYEHLRSTADSVFDPITGANYHRINLARAIDDVVLAPGFPAHRPITAADGVIHVQGTDGADAFGFSTGAEHMIDVNGVSYRFDAREYSQILFHGAGGEDRLSLRGTSGDERFTSRPGEIAFIGDGWSVTASDVEIVQAEGGGGHDAAVLHDSRGHERLEASPREARLRGDRFDHRVAGFADVQVVAAEGYDMAFLTGSAGDDVFVGRPSSALLEGAGYRLEARGFDFVRAAAAGGEDRAELHDSAGGDRFFARPGLAWITGRDYLNYVSGFDFVHAHAGAGGFDMAWLFDSRNDDRLTSRAGDVLLAGPGFQHRTTGFETVRAISSAGGEDRAQFFVAPGDTLSVTRGEAIHVSGSELRIANHFARTEELGALDSVFDELGAP
jgi:subtilisin family serine protease